MWAAIHCRTNYEKSLQAALQSKGFQEFLPTYKIESKWSDRTQTIERPLFPGYLFFRINLSLEFPTARGFIRILQPEIRDEQMIAIRRLCDLPVMPHPGAKPGERIVIKRGPLRGVSGVVERDANNCRVVVNIEMLHRAVSVAVDASDLV
jgi:transcription antitermination factor NusG